jgi:hypothetical protein
MPAVRRLAAILAADVAGYSRLMGVDEESTHERLKAHRRELVDPKIGEHSGRIVKTTGDGLLAEFPSVPNPKFAISRSGFGANYGFKSTRANHWILVWYGFEVPQCRPPPR